MNINYLFIIISITVYVCVILFHELGHYFALRGYKIKNVSFGINWKRKSFTVGNPENYKRLNDRQKANVYFCGIVAGLIPLVFSVTLLNGFVSIIIFSFYLFGCVPDFRKIQACGGVGQLFDGLK